MTNPIPRWDNAYCPNCGKLTNTVYDHLIERRIEAYCEDCDVMFEIRYMTAYSWKMKKKNEEYLKLKDVKV